MTFIHLHGHSTFSFLEAIGTTKSVIPKIKELNQSAVAITDYYGLYGAIALYNTARDHDIKPIIGVEIGFVMDRKTHTDTDKIGNICLLATSNTGYHNLLKLVSFANTTAREGKPKIDMQLLQQYSKDIICFMGGVNSRIGKMILRDEPTDKITEIIGLLQKTLGETNVYGEIIAQDEKITDIKTINTAILDIAQKQSISCIVDNNFHYVNDADRDAWEAALAIKDGKKMFDDSRRNPAGDYHIMTEEEIINVCTNNGYSDEQIQAWIDTNNAIAKQIDIDIPMGQTLFPNYETPEDIKELYEKHKDNLVEK